MLQDSLSQRAQSKGIQQHCLPLQADLLHLHTVKRQSCCCPTPQHSLLLQVDLLYLHNVVEMQLEELGETEVLHRLHEAFVWLEHARQDGSIRAYGMATWDCFR